MKKDLLIGLVTMAVSAAAVFDLINMKQGFIMADQVSASFFPYMMVGFLGLLGVLQTVSASAALLRARKQPVPKGATTAGNRFWQRYQVPFLMFLFVAIYIFLIPVVGFYTMTVLFFMALGVLLGGLSLRNCLSVVGAIAVTVLVMYYVFQVSLQIYMPAGIFY